MIANKKTHIGTDICTVGLSSPVVQKFSLPKTQNIQLRLNVAGKHECLSEMDYYA